jgi:sugar/nucleoside kinase (ribokinase family)
VIRGGPIDPVGAGDTFIAALAAGLAAGATSQEACALASLASGITLRKLHITGTASPEEILDLYQRMDGG